MMTATCRSNSVFGLAKEFTEENGMTFIPPFDDLKIIEGQGTVGVEILEDLSDIDYLFIPVGGGGLSAGVGSYFKTYSPKTKIIGLEPEGAPAMYEALKAGKPVTLETIDRFVDGAAVKRVGDITFSICKDVLDDMHLVPEGKVCSTILKLYNEIMMKEVQRSRIVDMKLYDEIMVKKTILKEENKAKFTKKTNHIKNL